MDFFTTDIESLDAGMKLLVFLIRLLLALGASFLIGLDRTKRFKEAGVRTHCIIAVASCAIMIVSKYGFSDLANIISGARTSDPARLAAQIVSGIGFLGAAVIFKQGGSVHGLTTAAGMWATSAIGMLFGAGMYSVGIITTFLIWMLLFVMHKFHLGMDAYNMYNLRIEMEDSEELKEKINKLIIEHGATITRTSISRDNGRIKMDYELRALENFTSEEIMTFLESNPGVYSMSA